VRRKNEECAERNFPFQQRLRALKGQLFEKIEWGVICLLSMNSLKIKFFGYLETKSALCAYGDAKRRNKY
jgi:hypothetical protein